MFIKFSDGKLSGVLTAHIDDLFHAGDISFQKDVMAKLAQRFQVGTQFTQDFIYVGFHVSQMEDRVLVDQNHYLSSLPVITVRNNRDKKSELNSGELTQLRAAVGSLNWIVQGTRPDSSFEMLELSTKFKDGTCQDLISASKLATKIKSQDCSIIFPKLQDISGWKLLLFTDAAFGNLPDGVSSTQAYVIFLVDQRGKCCPVEWKSNKIRRVCRSTLAAESYALHDGLGAAIIMKKALQEMFPCIDFPISVKVDCKALIEALHSTSPVEEKLLRLTIAAIKQLAEEFNLCFSWIPGNLQLANGMTKRGASGADLLAALQSGCIDPTYL